MAASMRLTFSGQMSTMADDPFVPGVPRCADADAARLL